MQNKKTIIIVDPIKAAYDIVNAGINMDYNILELFTIDLHIHDELDHPNIKRVIWKHDMTCIDKALNGTTPVAVIPGVDSAVAITDKIAKHYNLLGNDPSSSDARRNKLAMREKFMKAGLLPEGFFFKKCSTDKDVDAIALNHEFPMIIKTPQGYGSHLVFVCNNKAEMKEYLHQIINNNNYFGQRDTYALVEKLAEGEEYCIDIFRNKNGESLMNVSDYEKAKLANGREFYNNISQVIDENDRKLLADFSSKMADAVGIKYGAIHAEIIWDKENGIMVPVEIANRMIGDHLAEYISDCSNINMFDEIIKIYVDDSYKIPKDIKFHKHFMLAVCHTNKPGIVQNIRGLEEIKNLNSYREHDLLVKIGKYCPVTTDYLSSPLVVYIVDPDQKKLYQDSKFIHNIFQLEY